MSASINTTKASLGMEFIKKASGYVAEGTKEYFTSAMPVTTSIWSEAKSSYNEARSALANTAQDVLPKMRQLNMQQGLRSLSKWFLDKEDQFSFDGGGGNRDWDDGTSSADIAQTQISEAKENANQISGAIVESIHKSVEAQIATTSNILTSLDKQSAVISAGFKETNATLAKILEVLTKNTATLIETTAMASKEESSKDRMIRSGQFNLADYKKIVKQNINQSEYGMVLGMLPLLMDKSLRTPDNVVKMLIGAGLDKASPNLKKNMKAFDEVINDTIMSSLLRLGESQSQSFGGRIAKLFGIKSQKETIDTSRATMSLKSVPYDSISKDAITSAIPGYLRKILVALGGDDEVYDYRTRSFQTKRQLKRAFRDQSTADTRGSAGRATDRVRAMIRNDNISNMSYDLIINDIMNNLGSDKGRNLLKNLEDPKKAEAYITKLVGNVSAQDKARVKQFATMLATLDAFGRQDIFMQAQKAAVSRNTNLGNYARNADAMGVDLSFIKDTNKADVKHIKASYGYQDNSDSSIHQGGRSSSKRGGINYTNIALYEIFRRLDEGINVYNMEQYRDAPYKKFDTAYLKEPEGYRPKAISDKRATKTTSTGGISGSSYDYDSNPLKNGVDIDGNPENLTNGQRLGRWGKKRGEQFVGAMFNGSPEDVKAVMGYIVKDVSDVAGDSIKRGISSINDKFGNVSGYLSHKMFGGEYSYKETDPATGKTILKTVGKNEKGGLFGFVSDQVKDMFKAGKEKSSKWFSEVAGYFDYGDKDEKDSSVGTKRKKLIAASIGAYAGAGILGGPIGLLVGAVAGNALSSMGFGSKLKEKLFGKDKETGKPTGLLSKAFDKVITPFEYQIGKTMHHAGNALKKNIFGPLSDIGFAMKERAANATEKAVSKFWGGITKVLGKVWDGGKKLGGLLLSGFGFAGSGAAGGIARARISAGTAVPGGIMSGLASIIAHGDEETERALKERRKERKSKIKDDDYKYSSLKDYKNSRYEKNKADMAKLAEYTREQVISQKEIITTNEEIDKNGKKIIDIMTDIHDAITNRGSSKGKHPRGINGRFASKAEEIQAEGGVDIVNDDGANEYAGAIISGAATLTMGDGSSDNRESSIASDVIDESAKEHPNKKTLGAKFKNLLGLQKKKNDEEGKEKESIISKILGGISSVINNLPGIALAIAGVWAFLKDPNGMIARIGGAVESLAELFGLGKYEQRYDDATTGANIVTQAVADTKAKSLWAYSTPLTSLYHSQNDAAGNEIINRGMTRAKEEILYGANLRSALVNGQTITQMGNQIAANRMFKQGIKIGNQAENLMTAAEQNANGNIFQRGLSRLQSWRAGKKAGEADDILDAAYQQQALADENALVNTARGIGNATAKVGLMYGASSIGGLAAKTVATKLGASEEAAEVWGSVGSGVTSAALVVNEGVSHIKGNKSFLDKILEGLKKLFSIVKEKLLGDKALKEFGQESIEKAVTSYGDDVIKAVANCGDDAATAMAAKAAESTGKEAAGAASAGIMIAVGAVDGVVSGVCGVEHLFGVLPGDADAWMTTVSAIVTGIWHALEWTPVVGIVVSVIDIIDGILEGAIGIGIRQWLVRAIYTGFGFNKTAAEKLDALQSKFSDEVKYYNERYGASLSDATFNDMVNNTGWITALWNGKQKVGEDGHLIFDEAGARLQGGMSSWFNNNKRYVTDENGNVIKDEYGRAVQAVDANGNILTGQKRDKNGELVYDEEGNPVYEMAKYTTNWKNNWNTFKRFFAGGDIYETDENGQAIWDPETGGFKVIDHEGNIIDKAKDAGAAVAGWASDKWNSAKDWAGGAISTVGGWLGFGNREIKGNISDEAKSKMASSIVGPLGKLASSVLGIDVSNNSEGEDSGKPKPLASLIGGGIGKLIKKTTEGISSTIKDLKDSQYETDENGNPILDENGERVKKGGITGMLSRGLGKITSTVLSPLKKVASAIKGEDDELTDENGNPISTDVVKGGTLANKLGKTLKLSNIKDFAKTAMSKIVSSITDPLKSMSEGADEWEKDSAPWKSDGAKNAAEWVKNKFGGVLGKAGSIFSSLFAAAEEASTANTGGPAYATQMALSDGSDSGSISSISSTNVEEEGGNPLNKPFKITSGFGVTAGRPHSGAHKGIDLIPSDGNKDADVGARFSGTITQVKTDVPDSVTATKENGSWVFKGSSYQQTGNMVAITTDDGLVIKNMHLKAGSIPSNIKEGARVNIGDKLGKMGSTGWSTGAHLHYEFNRDGQAIDPTESATNGAMMSTFNTTGDGYYPAVDSISTETSSSSGSGTFGKLLEALKAAGNKVLYTLTGGLLGSDSEDTSSDSGSTLNVSSTYGSGLTIDSANLTTNANSKWLSIVRNVKQLVAQNKPRYDQRGYTTINYGGKILKVRTDCTGIICAMLKLYGVMGDNDNLNSDSMLNQGAIKNGFDLVVWPGWDKLVEGDILVRSGHAEIFAGNDGGKHYVYNGGSTEALCNPGATSSSKPSYTKIWRCREAVTVPALSTSTSTSVTADSKTMWNYFKSQGLSDYATAGLLGNLYAESGLRTNNLQNSYEKTLGSDEEYTAKVNSGAYTNFASDKAGYGLAQWTSSGRKAALYDLARSTGRGIDNPNLQLDYLMQELNSSYKNSVLSKLHTANSVRSASDIVLHKFEAPKDQSSTVEAKRAGYGQSFYNEFASDDSSMANMDGMGGPVSATGTTSSNIGTSRFSRAQQSRTANRVTTAGMQPAKIIQFPGNGNASTNMTNTGLTTGNTEVLVQLLYRVIAELESINGNTGSSSNLLRAIGENGIVDKGLRDQLSSIKPPKSSTRYTQTNPGNTRMVSSMVRP